MKLTLSSPAKINLYLHTSRRCPDGTHELQTLFQRIDLQDELTLTPLKEKRLILESDSPRLPLDHRNIVSAAYQLLREKCFLREGVRVFLRKRIPIGAGLGGGSGNAAGFLTGMNRLFRLGLPRDRLMALGSRLGADVPFFLLETSQALGRNRGDWLTPLSKKGNFQLLLVLFPKPLVTKEVYRHSDRFSPCPASLTKVSCEITMLSEFLNHGRWKELMALRHNDLELAAMKLYPNVRAVLSLLRRQASFVLMSGSGPAVFAMISSLKEGRRLREKLSSFDVRAVRVSSS